MKGKSETQYTHLPSRHYILPKIKQNKNSPTSLKRNLNLGSNFFIRVLFNFTLFS